MSNEKREYFHLEFQPSKSFPLMARVTAPGIDGTKITVNDLERDNFIKAVNRMILELGEIKKEATQRFEYER